MELQEMGVDGQDSTEPGGSNDDNIFSWSVHIRSCNTGTEASPWHTCPQARMLSFLKMTLLVSWYVFFWLGSSDLLGLCIMKR